MSLKLMSTIINTTQVTPACNDKGDGEKLLITLLDYVKQCQVRFGGKTELATEFDHCVAGLCSSLEAVLLHGLRTRPQESAHSSALKQVSDIVSSSLNFHSDTPSFWTFVKHHLTKHEQERYTVLRHVWTDVGRGRAWIRSALNERSLERYFHCLLSNPELLNKYYEDWAILCDQEKSAMLPNMAAGLGPILFAISIDKLDFNDGENMLNKMQHETEPIIVTESCSQRLEVKKKKRVPTQIISFDDDDENEDNKSCVSYTSGSSVSQEKNIPLDVSEETYKCEEYKSETVLVSQDKDVIPKCFGSASEDIPGISDNTQSQNSTTRSGAKTSFDKEADVTLTPVQQSEVGELIPISTEINQFISESPESTDETIEIPTDIVAVLTSVENKNKEELKQLMEKIDILTKENENLRLQLKNYVSAVQMLKLDSNSAHKALQTLSISHESVNEEFNYLVEAKMYENKLVQVAEMHGELMEFNDHLQKSLSQKTVALQRLRAELAELRGPMPSDHIDMDEDNCNSVGSVSICVPSAFLTGSGSEAHHVYQIYIRAGNDDWNIYRRYAQFYALHCELRKIDPVVANFNFPPKKSLGNKDASLVEDRRRRLQTYLRKVLAHWPELGNCNSRYLLERHLSFFRDQPNTNSKNNSKKSLFSSKKNTTPTSNDNHYTGL